MGLLSSGLCLISPVCAPASKDNTTVRHKGQTCPGQISSPRHLTDKKKGGWASPLTAGDRPLTKATELRGTSWQKDSGPILFFKGLLNMWRLRVLTCLIQGERKDCATKPSYAGSWTPVRINFQLWLQFKFTFKTGVQRERHWIVMFDIWFNFQLQL